jgi:hypothetical protein
MIASAAISRMRGGRSGSFVNDQLKPEREAVWLRHAMTRGPVSLKGTVPAKGGEPGPFRIGQRPVGERTRLFQGFHRHDGSKERFWTVLLKPECAAVQQLRSGMRHGH